MLLKIRSRGKLAFLRMIRTSARSGLPFFLHFSSLHSFLNALEECDLPRKSACRFSSSEILVIDLLLTFPPSNSQPLSILKPACQDNNKVNECPGDRDEETDECE